MSEPDEQQIEAECRKILKEVDIETTGTKQVFRLLGEAFPSTNTDFWSPRKAFVKKILVRVINEEDDESSEEEDDDDDDDDIELPSPKRKGTGGGLTQVKPISDKLANFLGLGNEMARTQIVKELTAYVKAHNLQNPQNRREILLDDKMKGVFGCDSFTFFTMQKYIGAHIHPFKPVDFTRSSSPGKRKAKKVTKSIGKKRKGPKQPVWILSDDLAAVVGQPKMARPQVVQQLWVYIKANNLQDPSDKRQIVCDVALKKVMKRAKVSMFKMNAELTPHLLEKVPGEYAEPKEDDE